MSLTPDREQKMERARQLKADGGCYKDIARELGVSWRTVMSWFNPQQGKRDADKIYRERHGDDPLFKARARLWVSRCSAKKHGYLPCTATPQEIAEAYTGACLLCEKPEEQLTKPLVIDHCHISGKFRGWICHKCNVMLGMAEDRPELLRRAADYLEQETCTSACTYRPKE